MSTPGNFCDFCGVFYRVGLLCPICFPVIRSMDAHQDHIDAHMRAIIVSQPALFSEKKKQKFNQVDSNGDYVLKKKRKPKKKAKKKK